MVCVYINSKVLIQLGKMNEQIEHDMCKNHTARSEKDFFRMCPSKLSKRELEDFYFALVESNMELKKTVNSQQDQIKLLNTKVQRMASQHPSNIRERKECCANNKAIINEQRAVIEDLKKSNDRLKDRIRLLNMRLCSAKQFLKKSPLQGSARCSKCCSGTPVSAKNSSTIGLNTKATEVSVRSGTASCQYLARDTGVVKSLMPGSPTREQQGGPCDQNECRTVIDQLEDKTTRLRQELSQTHEEYSSRMIRLEEEMSRIQEENVRVQAQQARETAGLVRQLRQCEARCEHLTIQLKIERSRAAELEVRAKVADMSSDVANAIETHLSNLSMNKEENEKRIKNNAINCISNVDESSFIHCQCQLTVPKSSVSSQTDGGSDTGCGKLNRADDSGYTDGSCEVSPKKDVKLLNQVAEVQAQLDSLKLALGDNYNNIDGKETLKTIKSRRKSLDKMAVSSNNLEDINCSARNPEYSDLVTNPLDSPKSINGYKEYDESVTDSPIGENVMPLVNSVEKERKDSKLHKEGHSDKANEEDNKLDDKSEKRKLDLSEINENHEINNTHRNVTSLDNNKVSTINNRNKHIHRASDEFSFTKEVGRVDGTLIHETDRRREFAADVKVDKKFRKLRKTTSNFKNGQNISVCGTKEVNGRRYVSTGVDPGNYSQITPAERETFTKDTNPLPLLEKNRLDICAGSVPVCTCPVSPARGPLRLGKTSSGSKLRLPHPPRHCEGVGDTYNMYRTSTPTQGTYVWPGAATRVAPATTSPDDTNCEISSLTDLSSEREVSPGEDRIGSTDSTSLSEGELPGPPSNHQSIGETQSPFDDRELRRNMLTPENMESTLRAVRDEVSRCGRLLRGVRPDFN